MTQTIAAPYSVRPVPEVSVSTPLLWNEVSKKLNPHAFQIRNIFDRLEKKGDLFQGILGSGIDLESSLERVSKLL